MKNIKRLILLISVILFTACNSLKTTSDFDNTVNFANYQSFGFSKESQDFPANDFVKNRIFNAISNNLKSKGIIESERPDILIDLGLKTKEKKNYATTNYDLSGFYGRRWRIGTGISKSNTQEINYTEGTLVINLIDTKKNQLLWMGTGTGVVNEKATKNESITAAINKILSTFPPK